MEALIAMAIFSAALIPLLSLQGQFVKTVESFERADTRIHVTEATLTHIRNLNLTQSPTGYLDMGAAEVSWEAKLAGPAQMMRGPAGINGKHQIGLYDVKVTLSYENGSTDTFEVRGLGWQLVSDMARERN